MIKINLLPLTLRAIKKKKSKPVVAGSAAAAHSSQVLHTKIALGALGVLFFAYSIYLNIDYLNLKKKTKSINAEVVLVQPQMQALKTLEQEVAQKLLPERDFLMTYVLNKAPLTTVLQIMSEALPDGAWLEKLVVNNSGKERSFRVQGRATTSQGKTNIEQIEDYLKKLQTAIPNAQFTYSTSKQIGEADLPSTAFDAEYKWQAD